MSDEELIARLLAEETDLTDCAVDRIEALKAKLAKAVKALEGLMMHEPDYSDTLWQHARDTLAEIKGESQDGMV